ncbi:hypothetical protein [Streptomyces noursei]|uniref:hypothetical protein n=1 Tax=Streptomyces noursei TaxID=1971 RepID=UPI003823B63C
MTTNSSVDEQRPTWNSETERLIDWVMKGGGEMPQRTVNHDNEPLKRHRRPDGDDVVLLRQLAQLISTLGQDYELDPGRGECADLLRDVADRLDKQTQAAAGNEINELRKENEDLKRHVDDLQRDADLLQNLYAVGVDDWSGFERAQEMLDSEE